MKQKYVLSVDQGTTSSRAILFNHKGEIVSLHQIEFTQIYPKPGWVEHDPLEILSTEIASIKTAVAKANLSFSDIDSIGITNQRETTILWDKITGEPIYNAIVWQCRRTEKCVKEMKKKNPLIDELIHDKTGLRLDPYFSATKIKWILDHVKDARERAKKGEILFGTIDSYILWHLTGKMVHSTDYTNASRTLLFNIHTLDWDNELLELFDIPKEILPSVHPSSYNFGYTSEAITDVKIPINGIAGDQQAALFGQLCLNDGEVKNTFGTGCFLLMNTGKKAIKSKHGLLTTLAASLDDKPSYVLEGSVFMGGALVKWLRDELKIFENVEETEKLAIKAKNSGGVYIVPAFTGLGAPYWDGDARGLICGLTRGTTKAQFVRAALEGICYQVYDVLKSMESDLGKEIVSLAVDGGASRNNFILQFEANILNTTVKRPTVVEVTALGAAYLSGLKSGYWKSIADISQNKEIESYFEPMLTEKERNKLIDGYHKAVEKAML